MLGDCQDLNLVFAWARRMFWSSQVDPADPERFREWPYPVEVRRKVAEKMKELAQCFDASEQAHRKEHQLTGNKAHVKVRFIWAWVSVCSNYGFTRKTTAITTRFSWPVVPSFPLFLPPVPSTLKKRRLSVSLSDSSA